MGSIFRLIDNDNLPLQMATSENSTSTFFDKNELNKATAKAESKTISTLMSLGVAKTLIHFGLSGDQAYFYCFTAFSILEPITEIFYLKVKQRYFNNLKFSEYLGKFIE